MSIKFKNLNKTIIKCKKCPRLTKFIKKISIEKRKQNINETYWGKPVTGFGDPNAKLLILGLAPAAHGGTRTGRAFTGDKSGEFLFKCLYKAKIANQPTSKNLKDGLKLNSTYITNILKCVPPGDKPLKEELNNCSNYFNYEISNLKRLKIIITLGKVAFDNFIKLYKAEYSTDRKISFKHNQMIRLLDGKILLSSYHPSPRNVNTKLINLKKMENFFKKAKKLL
jgi:uracil-DNA glycosylase